MKNHTTPSGSFTLSGYAWNWRSEPCADCDSLAVYIQFPSSDRWEHCGYCEAEDDPANTAREFAESQMDM